VTGPFFFGTAGGFVGCGYKCLRHLLAAESIEKVIKFSVLELVKVAL
jgi:hypothetical protein